MESSPDPSKQVAVNTNERILYSYESALSIFLYNRIFFKKEKPIPYGMSVSFEADDFNDNAKMYMVSCVNLKF